LGHGTTESRRRLSISDLTSLDLDPVLLSKVLESFGERRLLSFDRDATTEQATVEVAHEALFREWERLAGWIDRHRTALHRYASFSAATEEWEASERHPDYLLTGTRLAEFETWSREATLSITRKQREFLHAGLARQRDEQAAERARTDAERRLEQRALRRLEGLGFLLARTPSSSWPWLDDEPTSAYPFFAVHEGTYLAGVAAALKTRTGTIGFIGGYDDGYIWTWHAGYVAGARSIRPDIEVLSTYLGSGDSFGFHDASAAEKEATAMYEAGADIVFHAAGDSGVGVFEAASALSTEERQLWAIGVDTDQYLTVGDIAGAVHPDRWRQHILTSVIKRLDLASHERLADFAQGRHRPGIHTFNLASGGVDISYSGGFIDDIRSQIETAKEQIISGRVSVPCFPDEKSELARERGWPEGWCHN
jgi:hypothetical protein